MGVLGYIHNHCNIISEDFLIESFFLDTMMSLPNPNCNVSRHYLVYDTFGT